MTQLADTLFQDSSPQHWHQILQLQSTSISQLTYNQSQFNISAAKLQVSQYYLSLVGKSISSTALLTLLERISFNIGTIELFPLTEVTTDNGTLDICVLGLPSFTVEQHNTLLELLRGWGADYHVDFALTQALPTLSKAGIVLMDMDSTTIQIECIDEIAKLAGVGEQVAAVTAQAMNGSLDFSQSLRSRVATLTDCPDAVLQQVADNMPLMPGLKLLIQTLHDAQWKVAIASGGFTYFAERLQQDLGFDDVFANQLEIKDNTLTGKVIGDIVDAQVKADTLSALAHKYSIEKAQTVAIGDGANDLLMLAKAALGVAIHAKPVVQAQAQVSLNYHDLEGLVGLLHCGTQLEKSWN